MRGFVLSTVVYLLVAIVSVSVLFMLVNTYAPNVTRSGVCWALRGISTLIPTFEWARGSVPSFCITPSQFAETVIEGSGDEVATELAVHSLACWKKSADGLYNKSMICSSLYIKDVEGDSIITEMNVTDAIRGNTGCQDFMNNQTEDTGKATQCGDRNQLVWNVTERVTTGVYLIIKYVPVANSTGIVVIR